jgi:hypothetical protein
VEDLARAGYLAKGIVYLLIGILAFQTAAGTGGSVSGSDGALLTILHQPLGRVLLGLTAVGLFGYALWRLFCAAFDPERHGNHTKRILVRIGYAGSALAHGGLALEGARLALGKSGAGRDRAESWTARLMEAPLGPWLVGAVALGVAAYGVAQIARGLGRMEERLRLGELAPEERRLVIRVGRIGHVARGVVFGIIGVLLMRAALAHDARGAGGLGAALQALERQPYAPVLLGIVAVGLAAYGAYELVKARYRVIA